MRRVLVIAVREYLSYLRTPGFWLSLLIAPLGSGLALMAPGLMERSTPPPRLAVVDLTAGPRRGEVAAAVADALRTPPPPAGTRGPAPPPVAMLVDPPPEAARAADPEAAGRALKPYVGPSGELDVAAVVSGALDRPRLDIWSRNLSDRSVETTVREAVSQVMRRERLSAAGLDPGLLTQLETMTPEVRDFSPSVAAGGAAGADGRVALRDRLPGVIGFGLAFTLWALVLTGAGILLNSVIEEKSNRVLEVLLSSADTAEILGGKILGVAGLAFTVLGVWGGLALLVLARTRPELMAEVWPALSAHGLIGWFLLYFVGGYLMYAALFAAIGSFCETTREAQTLLGPVMISLTLPLVLMSTAVRRPDAPMLRALSWFPPFTPFLMTARAASGPPVVELAGAWLVMALFAAGVVWLSARAFRAGALSTGRFNPGVALAALLGRRPAL